MNAFQCGLNGLKFEDMYNRAPVRVQQGLTRKKKSGYRPRGIRATQHIGPVPASQQRKTTPAR